ncbi:YihY family inner membrane protein [Zoogloea sp.]|uniref:YihY family inner membrane protein n=1 Tax=Zoogloea sp. TaxID=49181 RepID=UPI002614410C|nr:YihY family inner membrane protein [Zoogloea sp.]
MNSRPDSGDDFRQRVSGLAVSVRHLLVAIWRRFREGHCAQVAASLAFTTLLSLVPFVTLVAVVSSKFPQSAHLDAALRGFLLDNLLPDKAGKVIAGYAIQFSQKATNLTIAGAFALVVTAVLLMKTIDQVLNQIWMVRSRRPWATRLAAYWMALSFGPILLAGGVFLASAMLSMSLNIVNEPVWLEAAGLRFISVAVLSGVFAMLYYAVPHCSVRLGDAVVAGVLAAVGLSVMQRLFSFYLIHFPSYTLVYGAFAAVPIFLLWLYLSWIVILLGAVVAAVLPERNLRRRPLPVFPGRRLYVALQIIAELVEAQREGGQRDVDVLADAARCGHGEVRELLEVLECARIAARREDGGWLLARAAEDVLLAEVARLFAWNLPASASLPVAGTEAGIDSRWRDLVSALDAAAAIPIDTLATKRT